MDSPTVSVPVDVVRRLPYADLCDLIEPARFLELLEELPASTIERLFVRETTTGEPVHGVRRNAPDAAPGLLSPIEEPTIAAPRAKVAPEPPGVSKETLDLVRVELSGGPQTSATMAERLTISPKTAGRALEILRSNGLAFSDGKKRGATYTLAVVPPPAEADDEPADDVQTTIPGAE